MAAALEVRWEFPSCLSQGLLSRPVPLGSLLGPSMGPPCQQDVVGRHVLKVEPLNAILDPHYFVRAVHGCVLAVRAQRAQQAQQRGGAPAAPDVRWPPHPAAPTRAGHLAYAVKNHPEQPSGACGQVLSTRAVSLSQGLLEGCLGTEAAKGASHWVGFLCGEWRCTLWLCRLQHNGGQDVGRAPGNSTALPPRPPAHHSRRARDLWSIVQQRLTAVIRVRDAMQDQ